MKIKTLLTIIVLGVLPFKLFANSIYNPPWCDDNYEWQNRKGYDVLDRNLVSKTILDKVQYSNEYSRLVIEFYSKSFSDTVIEYTNYKGVKKSFIIEGMRVGEFYDFLTQNIVNSNVQLYKYVTCSKQFTELNPAKYKKTQIDMMFPPNGKGTITRYGTEYAKIHNLATAITYYMKAVTSITDYGTKDADDFTKAYIQYLTEIGSGKLAILFLKIKNAKDNFELLNIVFDEAFNVLKVVGENPKYSHLKSAIKFGSGFKDSYSEWEKTRNNDVYEKHNVLKDIEKDLTKMFHDSGKKGLDALIKYTGLEGALKGTESAVNFIIASAMFTDMHNESHINPMQFSAYHFKDVPYNNDYSTIAIYSLLANESIPSPKKEKGYNFYPNKSITAGDLSNMLINELLYDEYMTYRSNLTYESNKLYFLFNKVFGMKAGITKETSDLVNTKEILLYLKYIFKYKTLKIAEKKYGKNTDFTKLENALDKLASKSFGMGKINDDDVNRLVTRVESARVVFSTKQYDWDDVVTRVYEGISVELLEKALKYQQYGNDMFYKVEIPAVKIMPTIKIDVMGGN